MRAQKCYHQPHVDAWVPADLGCRRHVRGFLRPEAGIPAKRVTRQNILNLSRPFRYHSTVFRLKSTSTAAVDLRNGRVANRNAKESGERVKTEQNTEKWYTGGWLVPRQVLGGGTRSICKRGAEGGEYRNLVLRNLKVRRRPIGKRWDDGNTEKCKIDSWHRLPSRPVLRCTCQARPDLWTGHSVIECCCRVPALTGCEAVARCVVRQPLALGRRGE